MPLNRITHLKNSFSISFWLTYSALGVFLASSSCFLASLLSSKSSAIACFMNCISFWRFLKSSCIVLSDTGAIFIHYWHKGLSPIYNLRFGGGGKKLPLIV